MTDKFIDRLDPSTYVRHEDKIKRPQSVFLEAKQLAEYFPPLTGAAQSVHAAMFDTLFDVARTAPTQGVQGKITDHQKFAHPNIKKEYAPDHFILNGKIQSVFHEYVTLVNKGVKDITKISCSAKLPIEIRDEKQIEVGSQQSARELVFALEDILQYQGYLGMHDLTKGRMLKIYKSIGYVGKSAFDKNVKVFYGIN